MAKYVTRRVAGFIPTLLFLLFLVVVLIDLLPGDVVNVLLSEHGRVTEETRRSIEAQLGLDRHLMLRYMDYVVAAVQGDLGNSLFGNRPVADLIMGRLTVTAQLAVMSLLLGGAFGIMVGVISAVKQDSFIDYLLRSVALLGISVPNFAIATSIVIFPAIWWGTTVNLRYVSFAEDPFANLKILILPAVVLGLNLSASLMRLMRTTMLEVLRQDYIRTASAKGLAQRNVLFRHAAKNALIPVVTVLGIQLSVLFGGSVIVESVFALPGVGNLLIRAVNERDYPLIQGIVLVIGVIVVVANLLVDLSYAWLDPRIRYG